MVVKLIVSRMAMALSSRSEKSSVVTISSTCIKICIHMWNNGIRRNSIPCGPITACRWFSESIIASYECLMRMLAGQISLLWQREP